MIAANQYNKIFIRHYNTTNTKKNETTDKITLQTIAWALKCKTQDATTEFKDSFFKIVFTVGADYPVSMEKKLDFSWAD